MSAFDFNRPTFITPEMTQPLGTGPNPNMDELFRLAADADDLEVELENLPDFQKKWDTLSETEQRGVMLSVGKDPKTELGQQVRSVQGPMAGKAFEQLDGPSSARLMGFEAGSDAEIAWLDRVQKVRDSGDKALLGELKCDFIGGRNAQVRKISKPILEAAKNGDSLLRLQRSLRGYDGWVGTVRIAEETVANDILQGTVVGAAQLGLSGAYLATKGIDAAAAAILPESVRPAPMAEVVDKGIKYLDEVEPVLKPIAREGFIDDATSGLTQALGYVGVGLLTGGSAALARGGAAAAGGAVARKTTMQMVRAKLTKGAIATFGRPSVANAMMMGMTYNSAMDITKDVPSTMARIGIASVTALLGLKFEQMQFGKNLRLFDSPLAKTVTATVLKPSISNWFEETGQGAVENVAGMASDYLSGETNDRSWMNVLYQGAVGGVVGSVLGVMGSGRQYAQEKSNARLLRAVRQVAPAAAEFVDSDDVPDSMKQAAFREMMGENGKARVKIDAAGVVEMGSEAVKTLAQASGVRESVIRAAAKEGEDIAVPLADALYADAQINKGATNATVRDGTGSGTAGGGDNAAVDSPVRVLPPVKTQGIVTTLLDKEQSREDKAKYLIALRIRNTGKGSADAPLGETEQANLNEILDLAEAADDTERIRAAVAAGTATPRELAMWRTFNETGSAEGTGSTTTDQTQLQEEADVAGPESVQRSLQTKDVQGKKYLVNLDAREKMYARAKEFVTAGRRKSLHDLFRATSESANVQELQLVDSDLADFAAEAENMTQISALDTVKAIQNMRQEMLEATGNDTEYVERSMELYKAFVVQTARAQGIPPAVYATSRYVKTVLRTQDVRAHVDSLYRMDAAAETAALRRDNISIRKALRTAKQNAVEGDTRTPAELLAAKVDTADAMKTPDGQTVAFVWNGHREDRLLAGVMRKGMGAGIEQIPDIIATGEMNEYAGGRMRDYQKGRFRVTLRRVGNVWAPVGMTRVNPDAPAAETVSSSPNVEAALKRSKAPDRIRPVLQKMLELLDAQGIPLENLAAIEKLATRATDAAEAFEGYADQILDVTKNLTEIPHGLIELLGVELPEGVDLQGMVGEARKFIENLRDQSRALRNGEGLSENLILAQSPDRNQIFGEGNTNVDGLTYEEWLQKSANGDFIQTLLKEKRINDGSEKEPFSSFENFSKPYDRETLKANVRKYLESIFSPENLGSKNEAQAGKLSGVMKDFFDRSGIVEYIVGFSEYCGFVGNTDPRIFCDLKVGVTNEFPIDKFGEFNSADMSIKISQAVGKRMAVGALTSESDADARTAQQGLANAIVHEFNHLLMYRMIEETLGPVTDVGPFYSEIIRAAGGNPEGVTRASIIREWKRIGKPQSRSKDEFLRYLSKPTEQVSMLAELLFTSASEVLPPAELMDMGAAYGLNFKADVFRSPEIASDMLKIHALFTATTQPELMRILSSGLRYQSTLGSIARLAPRVHSITLHGGRFNYSTIPHELFHLFLDIMRDDNPAQLRELLTAAGLPPDTVLTTAQEEKLARQFEMYLLGGKAPAMGLRKTFNRFGEWLGNIYDEKFRGANEVNPELARVFDKFFASDQQIRLTERIAGIETTYLSMLEDDNPKKKAVAAKQSKARLTAQEKERRLVVGTYMRISGEFKEMRARAVEEVGLDPVNTFIDEAVARGVLSRPKLHSVEGANPIVAGKEGEFLEMVAEWNTEHYDQLFETPEDALAAMRAKGPRKDQVAQRFNELKDLRYAEVIRDLGGLDAIAEGAVFSKEMTAYLDKLQEAVQVEKVKKTLHGLQAALDDAADVKADNDFNKGTVRERKSYRKYVGSMRKNLKKFADYLSKGDPVNASIYLANARAAERKVTSAVQLRDKVAKAKSAWRKSPAKRLSKVTRRHRDNIASILAAYKINPRMTTTTGEKQTTLNLPDPPEEGTPGSGMDTLIRNIYDSLPDWIRELRLPDGRAINGMEDLTVSEFNQIMDALALLEKAGGDAWRAMKEEQYAKPSEWVEESVKRMEELKDRPEDYSKEGGPAGWLKDGADHASMLGLLNEYIFQKADGHKNLEKQGGGGPMVDLFYAAQRAASDAEDLSEAYTRELRPLLTAWRELFTKNFDPRQFGTLPPEIAKKHALKDWTPEAVLMVALNTGNALNLAALQDGYKMDVADIEDVMNGIGPEGGRIVQGIGDILERLYEPQVKVFERIAGRTPPPRKKLAVQYEDYSVKGWYFPLVTEASTPDGSMFLYDLFPAISREPSQMHEAVGSKKPPVLDVGVLYNHVYSAARLIASGDVMDGVKRVVFDERWAKMFISRFGSERYNDVLKHFDMVANPHIIYSNSKFPGAGLLNYGRSAAVVSSLGLRLMSGIRQWTDIIPVVNVMRQQNKASLYENMKALASAIRSNGIRGSFGLYQMPSVDADGNIFIGDRKVEADQLSAMQLVFAKSSIMRSRDRRLDMNLSHEARKAVGDRRTLRIFGRDVGWNEVQDAMFAFIRMFDRGISSAAWQAQYNLSKAGNGTFAIDSGMTHEEVEARAIQDADALAKTMSSGAISDQTAAQRNAGMRIFTTFLSSQTRRGSRMWASVDAWRGGKISAKTMFANLAVEWYGRILLTSGTSYLLYSVRDAILGIDGDEEKEVKWDELALSVLAEPLWGTLEVIPLGSQISGMGRGYARDPLGTPLQTKLAVATSDVRAAKKAWAKGDYATALLRGAYAAGYATKVPLRGVMQDVKDAREFVTGKKEK